MCVAAWTGVGIRRVSGLLVQLKVVLRCNTIHPFIPQSVLRQVHSLMQNEFFAECALVLPLAISSALAFPQGHLQVPLLIPTWYTIFLYKLHKIKFLYMFRASSAHPQEVNDVNCTCMQNLVFSFSAGGRPSCALAKGRLLYGLPNLKIYKLFTSSSSSYRHISSVLSFLQ